MSDSAFDRIFALLFGEMRAKSADHILVSKSHLKVAVHYQEKWFEFKHEKHKLWWKDWLDSGDRRLIVKDFRSTLEEN